jgi:hypothetical protein
MVLGEELSEAASQSPMVDCHRHFSGLVRLPVETSAGHACHQMLFEGLRVESSV